MVIQSSSVVSTNMRVLYIVCTSYIILPIQLVQLHKPADIINLDAGELELKAKVGTLPFPYYPTSQRDQSATQRGAEVVDFIELVPNIDPLNVPVIAPISYKKHRFAHADIIIKNFTASGIKSLQLKGIKLRLSDLNTMIRTDLNVSIPSITFSVHIKIQGKISFIPLMFSCRISGHLTDIDVFISFGSQRALEPKEKLEVLQITSAAVRLHLKNIRLNITNISFKGTREEYEKLSIGQLLSVANAGGNVFDRMLLSGVKYANQQLLSVPFELIENYLLSDEYDAGNVPHVKSSPQLGKKRGKRETEESVEHDSL